MERMKKVRDQALPDVRPYIAEKNRVFKEPPKPKKEGKKGKDAKKKK